MLVLKVCKKSMKSKKCISKTFFIVETQSTISCNNMEVQTENSNPDEPESGILISSNLYRYETIVFYTHFNITYLAAFVK